MTQDVPSSQIVDAIEIHWRLQLGSYFKSVHDLDGATYNFAGQVTDYFWNYAGLIRTTTQNTEAVIERAIDFATQLNREPAFYIDPTVEPPTFADALRTHGFEPEDQEVWMFYPTGSENPAFAAATDEEFSIQHVADEDRMQAFVEVFHDSYHFRHEPCFNAYNFHCYYYRYSRCLRAGK
ncbi:hypothetical protein LCGC14_3151620, partial [marine sediment metagenome]